MTTTFVYPQISDKGYMLLPADIHRRIKKANSIRLSEFYKLLHSKVIAYVPNAAIKYVLNQTDSEGKRGKWIAKIMEYDVDIRPTKLVKGQGLAKFLADSNFQALGLHLMVE